LLIKKKERVVWKQTEAHDGFCPDSIKVAGSWGVMRCHKKERRATANRQIYGKGREAISQDKEARGER